MATLTTSAFERSHGRKPRGRGRWAFQASRTRIALSHDRQGPVFYADGTFTEAFAVARKSYTLSGADVIAVLP